MMKAHTKSHAKSHKKRGPVPSARTDLHKRKKPTVAKHVTHEFRSKRVKLTSKERIMARGYKEHDDEVTEAEVTPVAEAPAKPEAPPELGPAKELYFMLRDSYNKGGGMINPRMVELAQALLGTEAKK